MSEENPSRAASPEMNVRLKYRQLPVASLEEVRVRLVPPRPEHYYLACNSLMNELHQCLVFERFCKEADSSRIECGLAH